MRNLSRPRYSIRRRSSVRVPRLQRSTPTIRQENKTRKGNADDFPKGLGLRNQGRETPKPRNGTMDHRRAVEHGAKPGSATEKQTERTKTLRSAQPRSRKRL